MYDILRDYTWTIASANARNNAPRIKCKTHRVTDNQIYNSIKGYQNVASTSGIQYYDNLHTGTEEGDMWIFPFFTDEVRSFNNEWGDTYVGSTNGSQAAGSSLVGKGKEGLDNIANTVGQTGALVFGKPGALFEPPKFYTYGSSDNAATVEFTLINTYNEADARKNYDVIKKLITENRFNRGSSTIATPPVLWSVQIPGYRYIRWASCGVNISMLGRRQMSTFAYAEDVGPTLKDVIVPEGYRVALTFTSLYSEPNNFETKY
jgi:hypothetical protein